MRGNGLLRCVIGLIITIVCCMFFTACGEDHSHTFSDKWTIDDNYHYHVATCEHHDEVKDKEEHNWDNGVITVPATHTSKGKKVYKCSVCNHEKIVDVDMITTHEYNKKVVDDKYLMAPATCTSKAIYYYSCECGVKGSETFEHGSVIGHDWGDIIYSWSKDLSSCTATRICNNDHSHIETEEAVITTIVTQNQSCDEVELTTITASFKNPLFTSQTKANIQTKDKLNHNYEFSSFIWNEDYSCKVKTTCSHCQIDVILETTVNYTLISSSDCLNTGSCKYDVEVVINGVNHKDTKIVTLPIDTNNHNYVAFSEKAATCILPGHNEGSECSRCHEMKGGEEIPALGHEFIGECKRYDEHHHYKDCKNCTEKVLIDCIFSETYLYNNTHHYHECSACGNIKDNEKHQYVDGKCAKCDKVEEGHCTHHFIDGHDSDSHYKICTLCMVIDEDTRTSHQFNKQVVNNDYLKTPASCNLKAIYYYSCECGAKGSDTFVYGDALGHSYNDATWSWVQDGVNYIALCKFICTKDSNHIEIINADVTFAITVVPTCNKTGTKVFTATVVFNNKTYTDSKAVELAKDNNNHTLINDDKVDATCTDAGHKAGHHCEYCDYFDGHEVVPALGHNFTGLFIASDNEHHSRGCSRCSEKEVVSCTFSNDYHYDEDNHYHLCNICGNKKDVKSHSYIDDICISCGQKDPNACIHNYIDGHNDTHHYKICEHCSKINEETKVPHTFNQMVALEEYLKENATCTSLAIYYKSCSCGAKSNTTFEYGDLLDHDYSNVDWDVLIHPTCTEAGTLYKDCINCLETGRITKTIDAIGHSWDYENPIWLWTKEKEGCSAYYRYICLNDENHHLDNEAIVNIISQVDPTCIHEGSITYKATIVINDVEYSDNYVVTISINNDNHESDEFDYIDNEDGTHTAYHACCFEEEKTASCSNDTDDHDCTTLLLCKYCSAIIKQALNDHSYGEWEYKDDDSHIHRCTNPNCLHYEIEGHEGGVATCDEKATCDVCGTSYGNPLGHNYTLDGVDEIYHYCFVDGCEGREKHIFDSNHICTICNFELPYTSGLLFTLLESGTYKVSIGTSTETNIIIPSSYQSISVTDIDEAGFSGHNLNSIFIPNTIDTIGDMAFKNTNLEYIILPLNLLTLGNDVFDNDTILYYQKESKQFACNDDINIYYYKEVNPQVNGKYWHYIDDVICIWTKCELIGHTISGYIDINEDTHTYICNDCSEHITEEHFNHHQIVNNTNLYQEATCTEAALYHYICICNAKCHDTYEAGDPLGHKYGGFVEVQEMTCTDDQILERICEREGCGHVDEQINKTLGHYFIESKWFSNEDGHYHKCENCSEITTLVSHDPVQEEGIIQTPATCTHKGELLCLCSVCNYEVIVPIDLIPHTYTSWGFTAENHWHKCSLCNDPLEETITHHQLINVVSNEYLFEESTCTESAKYYKSCECGYCPRSSDFIFSEGSQLGHIWDEENPVWNWSEDGRSATVTYTCKRNGLHHDVINAVVNISSTTASTCISHGHIIYVGSITRGDNTITDEFNYELPIDSSNHNPDDEYHAELGDLFHYHICLDCGVIVESTKDSHHWDEGDVTPPSCTDYGLIEYTCIDCSLTYSNKIAKTEHNQSEEWDYNKDYHWHVCFDCGEMLKGTKSLHMWDEGVITTVATCSSYGIKTYTCTICEMTKEEQVVKADHTYNNLYYYYDELYHYNKCDDCNYYDIDTKAVHNHVDGLCVVCGQIDPATCSHSSWEAEWDKGHHWEVCCDCRKFKDDSWEEHNLELNSEMQPTCYSFGERVYICDCGYIKYETINKLDHNEDIEYWECDDDNHWHICQDCYEIIDESVTSHSWINALGEVVLEPTCLEPGDKIFICSICGYEKHEEIPLLGHNANPNLDVNTYMHYHTCSVCNSIIDFEYHTYSETASHDELHHWHECTVCHHIENEKTLHTFNKQLTTNLYLKTPATCTNCSVYYYSCICGEVGSETFEYGNALGHDHTDVSWTISKNPTCVDVGSQYKDCIRCGESGRITQDIPVISHSYQVTYSKNNVEHWHECSVCGEVESDPIEHVYDQTVIDDMYLVSENIRCGEYATYYHSCICGAIGYTFFTDGDRLAHDYHNALKTDECYHYCNRCNEKEAHEFGEDNICDICGYEALYTLGLKFTDYTEGTVKLSGLGKYFYNTKFVIPSQYNGKTVVGINYNLFQSNDNIIEIVLPDTIKTIDASTFSGCTSLQKINLENITSIGTDAFKNCESLTNIVLSTELTTVSNNLFKGLTNLQSIVIPEGVTTIGNSAFEDCTMLTSISLPSTLTTIGNAAFKNCGFEAFAIPSSITKINGQTFMNCTNLKNITIPEGVAYIGDDIFNGCSALESVVLPSSLIDFSGSYDKGLRAFQACTSLYSLSFAEGTTVTNIPNYFCDGCSNLTVINIPTSVITIGDFSFRNCSSLTNIEIPNGTTTIKSKAFQYCSGLVDVYLPDSITTIQDGAFQFCSSIDSVRLPNNLTTINSIVFSSCTSLKSVIIPSNVTNIANTAFATATKKIFYLGSLEALTFEGTNPIYYYSEEEPTGSEMLWHFVDGIPLVWDVCALGHHVYDQNVVDKLYLKTAPTCTNSAVYYRSCVCGEKGGEDDIFEHGAPLDHNTKIRFEFSNDYSKCTARIVCIVCGEVIEEETVNTLSNTIYEQSCDHEEIKVFTAEFESLSFNDHQSGYIKTKEATGHTYDNEVVAPLYLRSLADCENPSVYYLSCSCGHFIQDEDKTFSFGDAAGHELHNWVHDDYKKSDATCTSPAIYYKSCHCNYISSITFEYGKALGHSGDFVTTKNPTCLNDGLKTRTCTVCEHVENVILPALGHAYNAWTIEVSPTCEDAGLESHSCQRSGCTESESRIVPSLGHIMTNWNDVIPSSCITTGLSERHCDRHGCTHQETKSIIANGHTWGATTNLTEWSCREELVREQTCTVCGTKQHTVIPEKEHLYSTSWYKDEYHHYHIATCGCSLIKDKEPHSFIGNSCSVCGYTKSSLSPIDIPATTEGLTYTLEGDHYKVTIYDKATYSVISIPGTYNDKPVYLEGLAAVNSKRDVITTLYIQEGVLKIADNAFKDCINLNVVCIPNSLIEVGEAAFKGCVNLTSVRMGSNVSTIKSFAFDGCTKLANITMPQNIRTIYSYAFRNTSISELRIPKSIISIGSQAFAGCSNLNSVIFEYQGVSDTETRIISEQAFMNCSSLTTVHLPLRLSNISNQVFKGCTSLVNVYMNDGLITINDNSFEGCTRLTNIKIPNTVTSIGVEAFKGCSALTSVSFSSSINEIKDRAFYGCCLSSITIESPLVSIGTGVFYGNNNIDIVSINSTVGNKSCFDDNSITVFSGSWSSFKQLGNQSQSLKIATIDGSAGASIPSLFKDYINLEIVLLEGVVDLPNSIFKGCTSLKSLTFSGTIIRESAFEGCTGLTMLSLTGKVDIANNAFKDCTNLTYLVISNYTSTLTNSSFANCNIEYAIIPNNYKLYIPKTAMIACGYKTSDQTIVEIF